ncbi:hypothetical protein [Niabella sp.]|uniref:hypothetical protein n=1 Tax=Niabella sp. TaxID=1962976 RepID=UPI00261F2737|nr:hypothetical protein [Niabella sp.]
MEQTVPAAVSPLPEQPGSTDFVPVQTEPADRPANEKSGELAMIVLSEKPFITLSGAKQPRLPESATAIFQAAKVAGPDLIPPVPLRH